jgi:DNA-binding NtrC family response regulator
LSSSAALYKRVLLVEPDAAARSALLTAIGSIALVDPHLRFESARRRLAASPYDLLVTNIRLEEFNGLHLVYLVKLSGFPTRAIVHDAETDLGLARDAQTAGAFFERADRLPITLPSYVRSTLPERDRRHPAVFDRRTYPRGGRRVWDLHSLASAGSV